MKRIGKFLGIAILAYITFSMAISDSLTTVILALVGWVIVFIDNAE